MLTNFSRYLVTSEAPEETVNGNEDNQQKQKESEVECIARFFGSNQIMATTNVNKLVSYHSIGNKQFKFDLLNYFNNEFSIFTYRLQQGFLFNAYQNAKASVATYHARNYLGLRNKDVQIPLKNFYFGYDLWDYFYTCEQTKKENLSKGGTQYSNQTSGNKSFLNQSQILHNNSYFQHGSGFIYQNNCTALNPNDGILASFIGQRSDIKSRQALVYNIYGHLVFDELDRSDAINACGWSQISVSMKMQGNTNQPQLHDLCEKLDKHKLHYRAAAIAVCHFDFGQALSSLERLLKDESSQVNIYRYQQSEVQAKQLRKHKQEVKLLAQLLQGMKNIDSLLNEDIEIKQRLQYRVDWPSHSSKHERDTQFPFDQHFTEAELQKYANSKMFEPDLEIHEVLNINSKGLRLKIIQKSLEFIQTLLKGASFSHPYLQLIAKFISMDNFHVLFSTKVKGYLAHEIMDSTINLFDKAALWFRFLDPQTLKQVLQKAGEKSKQEGKLEWIIMTGKGEDSYNILRTYLDNTGDIQQAGTAALHMFFLDYPNPNQLIQIYYEYKQLLNQQQLYEIRAKFELELYDFDKLNKGKSESTQLITLLQQIENPFGQITDKDKIAVSCKYCAKSLGQPYLESQRKALIKRNCSTNQSMRTNPGDKERLLACPNCNSPLPKCCICTMIIGIPNLFLDKDEKSKRAGTSRVKQEEAVSLDNAYIWCQSCKHGGHFKHIMDWFNLYSKCPVADCSCDCSMI